MADPVPAPVPADLANAQFVVSITPEQYEARLKVKEAPARTSIELGGTGTAKASFKDAFGDDIKIVSSTWSATGSVTVTADDKDPTKAELATTGPGHSTITVTAQSENGATAQAHTEVMVIAKDTPVDGKIELTVKSAADAAAVAASAAPAAAPAEPAVASPPA